MPSLQSCPSAIKEETSPSPRPRRDGARQREILTERRAGRSYQSAPPSSGKWALRSTILALIRERLTANNIVTYRCFDGLRERAIRSGLTLTLSLSGAGTGDKWRPLHLLFLAVAVKRRQGSGLCALVLCQGPRARGYCAALDTRAA